MACSELHRACHIVGAPEATSAQQPVSRRGQGADLSQGGRGREELVGGAATSLLTLVPLTANRLPHLPLVLVHAAAGPGQALPSEEQLGQHQAPHQLGQHLV